MYSIYLHSQFSLLFMSIKYVYLFFPLPVAFLSFFGRGWGWGGHDSCRQAKLHKSTALQALLYNLSWTGRLYSWHSGARSADLASKGDQKPPHPHPTPSYPHSERCVCTCLPFAGVSPWEPHEWALNPLRPVLARFLLEKRFLTSMGPSWLHKGWIKKKQQQQCQAWLVRQ